MTELWENPPDLNVLPEGSAPIENLFLPPLAMPLRTAAAHYPTVVVEKSYPESAEPKYDSNFYYIQNQNCS